MGSRGREACEGSFLSTLIKTQADLKGLEGFCRLSQMHCGNRSFKAETSYDLLLLHYSAVSFIF